MDKVKQRIAIAEACGWTSVECMSRSTLVWGVPPSVFDDGTERCLKHTPDYLNDLNAMHEAEKVLDASQWDSYRKNLAKEWASNDDDGMWAAINATAAQRAEAFLKTIGKWEEESSESREKAIQRGKEALHEIAESRAKESSEKA